MIVDICVVWVVDRGADTGFCRGVNWKSKYFKYGIDVKFDVSLDWGVGYGVGDAVVRGNIDKVYSDVGDDGVEGFEWKVGVEVGSSYGKSCRWYCFWRCHKFFRGIKRVFNIRVGDSVGWDIGRVIGSGVIMEFDIELENGDNGGIKL